MNIRLDSSVKVVSKVKYVVEDLKSISDSDIVIMRKPKGFSIYILNLILVIVISILIWSIFAKKEIMINLSGVLNETTESEKIFISSVGSISVNNIIDGMIVKKDDVLLILNNEEENIEMNNIKSSIDENTKELQAANKFKNSIIEKTNMLDISNTYEKKYVYQYKCYIDELEELQNRKNIMIKQKDELTNSINDLYLFKKSILENKNYITINNSLYYEYLVYEKKMSEQIENNSNELSHEGIKNIELDEYKNTKLMDITNRVKKAEKQLNSIEIQSENKVINNYLNIIEEIIYQKEKNLNEVQYKMDSQNTILESKTIKAPCDGKLRLNSEINLGDYFSSKAQVADIVNENVEQNYMINIDIPMEQIDNVKEGEFIKFEVPNSEYGFINAKIDSISLTPQKNNETEEYYYTAKCNIDMDKLNSFKNVQQKIKNGINVNIKIAIKEVSYFKYIMELIR